MKKQLRKASGQLIDILWHWLKIMRIIVVRFFSQGFAYRVSALTYTTLLGIVPVFAVLFFFLSLFRVFNDLGLKVQHYIFSNFVPATGEMIEKYFANFTSQAAKLPPVGIIALIAISIMLMFTIEQTFNDVWYVKVRRKGVRKFLLYWAIITIGPLSIGLSFFVSSYVFSSAVFSHNSALLGLQRSFLSISPFLLTAIGLTIMNVVVPNCKVKFRYGLLGGVLSAVFFELAKFGFAHYAYYMSSYRLIYGAIAIIPLFLLWIYISWFIILAGAILAHAAATTEKTYQGASLNPYIHAILILKALWSAQQAGDELSFKQIMLQVEGRFAVPTDVVLQDLLHSGLIKRTENSGFVIAFDFDHLTLYDFTNLVPWSVPNAEDLKQITSPRLSALKQCLLAFDTTFQAHFNVGLSKFFS